MYSEWPTPVHREYIYFSGSHEKDFHGPWTFASIVERYQNEFYRYKSVHSFLFPLEEMWCTCNVSTGDPTPQMRVKCRPVGFSLPWLHQLPIFYQFFLSQGGRHMSYYYYYFFIDRSLCYSFPCHACLKPALFLTLTRTNVALHIAVFGFPLSTPLK